MYSTKRKRFLTIIKEEEETYVMIEKNDTVLVRTRESVALSSELTGAFYSKVKVVSEGFGHVSTTLDPNWEGQLLISLNNPTNQRLKFSIEKQVYGKRICNSFVTLEFMYMNVETEKRSDNPPGRLDILDMTITQNVSRLRKNKIDDLKEIVAELHKQEKKTIDNLTVNFLDADEKEEWRQINIIKDDNVYKNRRNDFLKRKKEKYLRLVQSTFEENALDNIDMVNHYIEEKQKYLPMHAVIGMSLRRNSTKIICILISIVFACVALKYKKTEVIITYIFVPLLYFIMEGKSNKKR